MDIDAIRSFVAVVKYESISKAAECIYVTQPALSQRLKKLEEGLGFPLFYRDWKGTHLTEQGAYFLPYAVQLIVDLDGASQVLNSKLSAKTRSFSEAQHIEGKLVIGIDNWLPGSVMSAVSEQVLKYVNIDQFQIIVRPASTLIKLLDIGKIDIGVFYSIEDSYSFSSNLLYQESLALVHHESVVLGAISQEGLIDALRGKKFALFDNPILTHHSKVTSHLIHTYKIENFHIVDDFRAMLSLIALNECISTVPYGALQDYIPRLDHAIRITPLSELDESIRIDIGFTEAERESKTEIVAAINTIRSPC